METYSYAQLALGAWAVAARDSGWHARALAGPSTLGAQEEQALAQLVDTQARAQFSRIIMVGDNPLADITGANRAGAPWWSALVRTGVWKGEELEGERRPMGAFAGVGDAVKAGLAL